jgi:V/A-type H+-transporting ATPase subunit I
MKKATLFGTSDQKTDVLEKLQELGCMHLVPLEVEAGRPEDQPTAHPKEVMEALRYLLDSPTKRRQTTEESSFDMAAVVGQALQNRDRRREVQDRIDELEVRIRSVEPWGDFEFPPREELAGQRLWFYVVPCYQMKKVNESELVWQVVHKDHRQAWVVVLSEGQPPAEAMPVPRSRLGARPLSDLRKELERRHTELEDVQAERWSLTRWISLMVHNMDRAENRSALEHAESQTHDAGEIFAVQGWVPAKDTSGVLEFARSRGLACTLADPDPDESPPVLFHNKPAVQPGEDLLSFYQLPGYRDWDPSGVVYFSFAVFFAMIMADAGYAAVIGSITALLWKRLGKSASSRRARKMLASIFVASVVYGVLVGSYFGIAPAATSLLGKLKLLEINDFSSMMKLSIGVGVAHLVYANLRTAWHRRGSKAALVPFIYLAFILMLGDIARWFVSQGRVPNWHLAGGLFGGGLLLLVLFGGESLIDSVQKGVIKAFGDILSYLRLFALGLASSSLALTFNNLGAGVIDAGRGHGIALLLGLLILILGHGLNLALGIMSGVVHGLRLNLIEMLGWSVFGEGSPFRAFRKKETIKWTT